MKCLIKIWNMGVVLLFFRTNILSFIDKLKLSYTIEELNELNE